jgi:hypothetical protein
MKILAALSFLLLFFSRSGFADINLFLYPRVNYADRLTLLNIASIECDLETMAKIMDMAIDETFISDGYLDRKEIIYILKDKVAGTVNIYGNGVRILKADQAVVPQSLQSHVKRGDRVRFNVVNSHIRVEVSGIAMKDGVPGDVIPVKLRGQKIADGILLNERIVELKL